MFLDQAVQLVGGVHGADQLEGHGAVGPDEEEVGVVADLGEQGRLLEVAVRVRQLRSMIGRRGPLA